MASAELDPAVLAAIRAGMAKVKVPHAQDKVYKDECLYTFDTCVGLPFCLLQGEGGRHVAVSGWVLNLALLPRLGPSSPFTTTGLYVNLATWGGVGRDMLGFDSQRTGSTLFAHLRYTKVSRAVRGLQWMGLPSLPPVSVCFYKTIQSDTSIDCPTPRQVPLEEVADGGEKAEGGEATVLGIGVEGGFKLDSQKYDVVKEFALAVLSAPGDVASLVEVPFPNFAIPEFVSTAVQAIVDHQGAASQGDEAAWLAEEEPRPVSKNAEGLEQLDNGVKISANPTTWQCAESGQAENLWLNLSTGYIGSGRPQLVSE